MIFLWETITVDCAIYRLPLRSMCKGKGKRRRERRTEKGEKERERRKEKGKKENNEGERRKEKGNLEKKGGKGKLKVKGERE